MRLEEETKTKKFKNPYQRASLNVIFTGNWLMEQFNSVFKNFGISQQQYNVLRILKGQKGSNINLMDIQSRMIHKSSNTTRLVEKLRLKGYVERVLCENNRRKVEITITDGGLKILDDLEPVIHIDEQKLSKKLTKQEATTLGELLDKMRE